MKMKPRTVDWESEFQKYAGESDNKLREAAQFIAMDSKTQEIRAHKLKSAVHAYCVFLDLLKMDGTPNDLREYGPKIRRRLEELRPLVNDVTQVIIRLKKEMEATT